MNSTPHIPFDLSIILLHEGMVDRRGDRVTTSYTMVDMHDIARSSRTYNASSVFIAHPSPSLRKLAHSLLTHWSEGYGASYNPDRKEALSRVHVVESLEEAIHKTELRTGQLPVLVATSARQSPQSVTFADLSRQLMTSHRPYLLMLGTGWGMSPELLARADLLLEPIKGPSDYNHLSVRSACAIMLDKLLGGL